MSIHTIRTIALGGLIVLAALPTAEASCGAATCAVNTHWNTQGLTGTEGWGGDLRYEYIDQNQLRHGRDKVTPGDPPQHDDELQTLNRNVVGTLDYNTRDWGVTVTLPLIQRDHKHIHHHDDEVHGESWQFDDLGDARVLGRLRLNGGAADGRSQHGLLAGLKLPSGDTTERNSDGDLAERTLQPGTGTTDVLAGYYVNQGFLLGDTASQRFARLLVQAPLNASGGYRPGNQYGLDVGLIAPALGTVSTLLQVNAVIKDRDRGPSSEAQNSGGSFVWLSPGVSVAAGNTARVYGFVQVPLYQRVNGYQLTANWTATAGLNWRF
jgi:hypothetical protein